jgi:tRNA-guanine family transglycosylase
VSSGFKIIAATEAGGRRGQQSLPHKTVETPVFMPVGTDKAVALDALAEF